MSKYKFNDYTLPGLPAELSPITYPYQVIIKGTGVDDPADGFKFWLVGSGEEFTALNVDGTNCVAIKPYTVVHHFLYIRGDESWVWEDKGSLIVEDMDSTTMENLLYYYFNATKTEYIWCNEDIKDTSGNVVFAGSEPVLVEDDPEEPEEPATQYNDFWFWFGVALGLAGKGLPSTVQPTAYLYNGVKLPALPEWDREMYPYALVWDVVFENGEKMSGVEFTQDPAYCNGLSIMSGDGYVHTYCLYDDDRSTWVDEGENRYEVFKMLCGAEEVVWANYDILNEDGTVHLAASEPIPVYE